MSGSGIESLIPSPDWSEGLRAFSSCPDPSFAAPQSYFTDHCEVFHQPHPAADPTVKAFTFEKHVSMIYGGKFFAEIQKRGYLHSALRPSQINAR